MQVTSGLAHPRDKVLQYIEAAYVHNFTKKDAYLQYIDDKCKNPHAAIARLEKKKDFQDLLTTITSDENYKFMAKVQRVKSKYIGLVEKNIDTADKILDDASKEDIRTKATAVRLVNETVQAMAVIGGGGDAAKSPAPKIDPAGVIN